MAVGTLLRKETRNVGWPGLEPSAKRGEVPAVVHHFHPPGPAEFMTSPCTVTLRGGRHSESACYYPSIAEVYLFAIGTEIPCDHGCALDAVSHCH